MVGYDSVSFGVVSDGSLPLPTPEDGTGILSYAARVKLSTRADYRALQAMLSRATVRPAMGILAGGTAVVEAGPGALQLRYPDGPDEIAVEAILLSFAPVARILSGGPYLAECRWLIVEALPA